MDYQLQTSEGHVATFSFDVVEMEREYNYWLEASDCEWYSDTLDIAHFICYCLYHLPMDLKQAVSDTGVLHELIHLAALDDPIITVERTRKAYELAFKDIF